MTIRIQIDQIFNGRAFERPLFYSYKGGLRIELSVGGSFTNQFITANKKANELRQLIFSEQKTISVCLKFFGSKPLLSSLSIFRELRQLDISIPKNAEYWSEPNEEYDKCYWHYLAYSTS